MTARVGPLPGWIAAGGAFFVAFAAGLVLQAPAAEMVASFFRSVGLAFLLVGAVAAALAWRSLPRDEEVVRALVMPVAGAFALLLATLLTLVAVATARSPLHDGALVDRGPLASLMFVAVTGAICLWIVVDAWSGEIRQARRAFVAATVGAFGAAFALAGLYALVGASALAESAAQRPVSNTVYTRMIPGFEVPLLVVAVVVIVLVRRARK